MDTIDLDSIVPFGLAKDLAINIGTPQAEIGQSIGLSGIPGIVLASPLLKVPLAILFVKESFLGADIEKLDRNNLIGSVTQKVFGKSLATTLFGTRKLKDGGFRIDPTWNRIIRGLSPFSRLQSLLQRLVDPRLDNKEKIKSFFAAAAFGSTHKISEAEKRELKDRLRRSLKELEQEGLIRTGEFFFPTRAGREDRETLQRLNKFRLMSGR